MIWLDFPSSLFLTERSAQLLLTETQLVSPVIPTPSATNTRIMPCTTHTLEHSTFPLVRPFNRSITLPRFQPPPRPLSAALRPPPLNLRFHTLSYVPHSFPCWASVHLSLKFASSFGLPLQASRAFPNLHFCLFRSLVSSILRSLELPI